MKTLYTTILAVLLSVTAFAQTVYENFEDATIDPAITMNMSGNGWSFEESSSNPTPANGRFAQTANGNDTRTIIVTLNPGNNNKLTLNWFERKTDNSAGEIYTRTFAYRLVGDVNFTTISTDANIPYTAGWASITETLHTDDITNRAVELKISVTRTQGNKARYAFDEFYVSRSYTPITTTPLPVELASFQGQSLKSSTKLAWITATEKNNEKFVVERSLDGKNFSSIGEVKGSGNSSAKLSYSFTDNAPVGGVNYYRLRQVDLDGTESFSSVVALEAAAGDLAATVYPTAASQSVTISMQNASGNTAINVVDVTGRTVATFTNVTDREIELPVHSFRNGVYFVKVIDGQHQQVQRFIKQ